MIMLVFVCACRRIRKIDDPTFTFLSEQTTRHRSTGTNLGRIQQPAEGPVRLETLTCKEKVRRDCPCIVRRLAGNMTLQTRSSRGKHLSGHELLLISQRLEWLFDIRFLLA